MKALLLPRIGLDSLTLAELPPPALGPRDLLLETGAAALNFRDLAIARGTYGNFALPLVLGSDAVGRVIEVGAEVTRFSVGDRVCPLDTPDWIAGPPDARTQGRRLGGPEPGTLASRLRVPEEAAVRAPAHLADEEAATLAGAGVTAWQALFELGRVRPGDVVVVQGTGGVSLFAVQLALLAGAEVVVVSRSADKLERTRALGAKHCVNSTQHPDWSERVLAATRGRGADLVVDVLGGAELNRSIAATRNGGTVVLLGFVSGTTSSLDLPGAIRQNVALMTSSGRSRASFEALVRAFEVNELRPVVDRVFPFERAPAAFEHLANGSPFGKVVIRFEPGVLR